MAKKKSIPLITTELAKMAKNLQHESDRGVALIVAAWVDDALAEYVRGFLIQDAGALEELFRPMGPLGSFSSKIKMAYLLGLINELLMTNLDIVRDIRNDFAHSRKELAFSEQSVRDRCKNLLFGTLKSATGKPTNDKPESFTPRKAYVATGLIMAAYFIEQRSRGIKAEVFDGNSFQDLATSLASEMQKLITSRSGESET
jgi:Mannitol repressor